MLQRTCFCLFAILAVSVPCLLPATVPDSQVPGGQTFYCDAALHTPWCPPLAIGVVCNFKNPQFNNSIGANLTVMASMTTGPNCSAFAPLSCAARPGAKALMAVCVAHQKGLPW